MLFRSINLVVFYHCIISNAHKAVCSFIIVCLCLYHYATAVMYTLSIKNIHVTRGSNSSFNLRTEWKEDVRHCRLHRDKEKDANLVLYNVALRSLESRLFSMNLADWIGRKGYAHKKTRWS